MLVIYFTSHFVLQLRAYYKATNLYEGLQLGFAKRLQSDTFVAAGGRPAFSAHGAGHFPNGERPCLKSLRLCDL